MKGFLTLVILMGWAIVGVSQTLKITYFQNDNTVGLENAVIMDQAMSVLGITDNQGEVVIADSFSQITIQHVSIGYVKLSKTVVDSLLWNIRVYPNVELLSPLIVRGKMNEPIICWFPYIQKAENIRMLQPANAADAISNGGKVYIQKSQQGGGSPMIRGFSANRVLISIDGVKMNNAIFRSGNVHNLISLDAYDINQVNVFMGASSVFYGSDAIGGVVAISTKTPELKTSENLKTELSAILKYGSANRENTGRLYFETRHRKWASLSTFGFSKFGDVVMGNNGPESLTKPFVVETTDGKDSVFTNPNPNEQLFTRYSMFNTSHRFIYKEVGWNLDMKFMGSMTTNIPRYDRLIQLDDQGIPRFSDWKYGPQTWSQNFVKLNIIKPSSVFDQMSITNAYQRFKESRISRRFQDTKTFTNTEILDAYSFNLDAVKKVFGKVKLAYGGEFTHQWLSSDGYFQDRGIVGRVPDASRYPDQSKYVTAGIYAALDYRFKKGTDVNIGIRQSHTAALLPQDSAFLGNAIDLKRAFNNLNYSIGVAQLIKRNWSVFSNVGTGFRAPNIDDLGKVFDSRPGRVMVPNLELKAENSIYADLGFGYQKKKISFNIDGFINRLNDGVIVKNSQLNGSDSVLYQGELSQVESLQNVESITVYGLSFNFNIDAFEHWEFSANGNYMKGETNEGLPVRHVSPFDSRLQIKYVNKKLNLGLQVVHNAQISNQDLAPVEQAKPHIYVMDENNLPYSPSWYIINFNASYTFNPKTTFLLNIDNLTNQRYRTYSSGLVSPGLNIQLSVLLNIE